MNWAIFEDENGRYRIIREEYTHMVRPECVLVERSLSYLAALRIVEEHNKGV